VSDKEFEWEIKSGDSSTRLDLKSVWLYRDLLWLMVRRDFVSFYKQTIFGPLWFFFQPIATTIIFTFIFGDLARISTDGLPQSLFYMAGIISWNYFSECLTKTSTVFRDNAQIFGKVYFPRIIVPLSIVVSNLTRFAIQFALFIATMAFFAIKGKHFEPNSYILLFPLLVLLMAGLGLGFGMIISALTTKYRDLSFLLTFGIQLLMYTTTVIYPLSVAIERYNWSWIMQLNPMTPIIETFRYGFLGKGTFTWGLLGYSSGFTILVLFLGILIFNKIEKNFIDTV
jgi:lipopolysaccharide transport system permease protein